MSRRRALLGAAAIAAALVVVAAALVIARLDGIVRRAIETRGTALTGTPVRVDAAEIGLAAGRVRLRGLTIANPPGFTGPTALSLAEVEIGLEVLSLASNPLVIDTVRVIGPHVFYEVNGTGTANIDVLRATVEARRKAARAPAGGALDAGGERGHAAGRRLIIHLLELREGEVTVDGRAAGGALRTEQLPPFELSAIGVKQNGAAPAEVGRIILVALARDVALAVAADGLEHIAGKRVGGLLGKLLKKGGSGAIEQGLGAMLDRLFQKKQEPPATADGS
jgi:uncharacterized protein involved in outer membrane biogenesis